MKNADSSAALETPEGFLASVESSAASQIIQVGATGQAGCQTMWGNLKKNWPGLRQLTMNCIAITGKGIFKVQASGAGALQVCQEMRRRGAGCEIVSGQDNINNAAETARTTVAAANRTPSPQPTATPPARSSGLNCPAFANSAVETLRGNDGPIEVVRLPRAHLQNPNNFGRSVNDADNTIATRIACIWDSMKAAAALDGITLRVAAAFRTRVRQEYFYRCYRTQSCNNGNEAAVPGTSNHGDGISLDIGMPRDRVNVIYRWMRNHGGSFGFVENVPGEPWHWTYLRR